MSFSTFIKSMKELKSKKNYLKPKLFYGLLMIPKKFLCTKNSPPPKLVHTTHDPVQYYEEVESNEEPQHSSYIRHQGEGGVGLYLLQNLDLVTNKGWTKNCVRTSCHCGILYQL